MQEQIENRLRRQVKQRGGEATVEFLFFFLRDRARNSVANNEFAGRSNFLDRGSAIACPL